jgi:hypothetical protein
MRHNAVRGTGPGFDFVKDWVKVQPVRSPSLMPYLLTKKNLVSIKQSFIFAHL